MFGTWLKTQRERKGLTQSALAKALGEIDLPVRASQGRISRWECEVCFPTYSELVRVSGFLDADMTVGMAFWTASSLANETTLTRRRGAA